MGRPAVIVLTGPTGSGKSSALYGLPENMPIEIINADSRQIYKYMKIGTALPSSFELRRFPHHMFSFLEPSLPFSAGQFAAMSKNLILEIHGRQRIPVIIGGTFFYIRALWDGLIKPVAIAPAIEARVGALSLEEAYNLLQKTDPQRAKKIFMGDEYRVRRSLMICLAANAKISDLEKSGGIYDQYKFHSYYMDMDRKQLYERINQRVLKMFQEGLIAEIYELFEMGYSGKDPAMNSIGYKELLSIKNKYNLQSQTWPESVRGEAISVISKATRNFAKRQLTWFRNENRLKKVDHAHAVSQLSEIILGDDR
ncbi:MAG: tRNA (adenosine(37)-N6)-dimethylallyltransferase MiaA [Spirochaetia bacterium]|nr:tRNA (adenosine(37)-N6)-dimethylallyltransferase MiaA [Spirochaetia bacterium]